MKFQILGDKDKPALLFIHGMFCTAESCLPFAKLLKEEYYIILPILDGHYKGSDQLDDVNEEARKIVAYLHKEQIESLELLQGTSMGAEVALAVATVCDIPIKHYLYDGGPFFDFPTWFQFVMYKKFQRLIKKCAGKTEEEVLQDPFVKKLGGDKVESFRGMLRGFTKLSDFVTNDDIKAITKICYNCKLPEFDFEIQRRFLFLFSEREPAHMSKKRLRKKYPEAEYIDFPGNTHCGFQILDPKKYAEYIKEMIERDGISNDKNNIKD